ncbi:hypothetical protein [Hymenobacter lucidus]|uniref:NERD domain-containing protein n=1 Tax=Hymenobacter lucidus TaxID=2880930 RepID=A0ABS8AY92_9BACT|nr:hypothetical protein [Hymenobacter lucidus]MCB2410786.1 hypothetical protein [Hymenobacter lucidus]
MLHSFLFAPFSNPTHQAQYQAVQEALQQEAAAEPTLLLGNFAVADQAFDAVIIRPHSLTTLVFVAEPGQLTIGQLGQDTWQLGGQPLANPFRTLQRQQPVLAAWLGTDLSPTPIQSQDITGIVVFTEQATFGPSVEQQVRQQPEAESFQLLRHAAQLPRRLWPLVRPGINLAPAALLNWARELAEEPEADPTVAEEVADLVAPIGYWEHKAGQLWRWLGAEDIPLDMPYGYPPADAAAASRDEKQRLEQIRQQVRAELQAQTQATAAREAEREQLIGQLQSQLRQSSAQAPETAALQTRLAAETQQKAALQEAIRVAQAESAARNQALDARIEQLGSLIQELQNRPTTATPASAAPVVSAPAAVAAGTPRPATVARTRPVAKAAPAAGRWQLQWHRAAVVAAVAGGLGWAAWGIAHIAKELTDKAPAPTQTAKPRRSTAAQPATDEPAADPDQLRADSLAAAEEAQQRAEAARDSAADAEVPAEPADSSEVLQPTPEPELDDTSG